MTVLIRPAMPAEIPALAALAATSYREDFGALLDAAQLATRNEAHFTARFQDEWHYVRLIDGTAVGCLGFVEVRDGTLDMLFVDVRWVGNGLGVQLLRQAEAMGAVRLECFSANERARRFYEREGWQHRGDHSRQFAGRRMAFVSFVRDPAA
jgi:putative acetyltransferase